jgi:hypothetical protein
MSADLSFDMSDHPVIKLAEEIKKDRAFMLRNCSPKAYLTYHRKDQFEHTESQLCPCKPVTITQQDHRTSMYFAHQILYPQLH